MLWSDPRKRVAWAFALTVLSFALWSLGYARLYQATSEAQAWFWYRFASVGFTTASGLALVLTLVLVGIQGRKLATWATLTLAPGLVLAARSVTGILYTDAIWGDGQLLQARTLAPTAWPWLFLAYLAVTNAAMVALLWRWTGHARHRRDLRRRRLYLHSAMLSVGLVWVFNILGQVLDTSLPPLGHLGLLVWLGGVALAMVRYRFLLASPRDASEEIVHRVREALVLLDLDQRITWANEALLGWMGRSDRQLRGQPATDLFSAPALPPPDEAGHTRRMSLVGPDEALIPVDVELITLHDPAGEQTGYLLVIHDVRPLLELEEQQHMLSLVLDTIPVRVFWKDQESRYLGCNQLYAEDAGLVEAAEIVGLTDADLPWAARAEGRRSQEWTVMRTDTPIVISHERVERAGQPEAWFSRSIYPLRAPDGEFLGVLGVAEDVTLRRQAVQSLRAAKEEAERANESKSRFLDYISHELRTPLNCFMGYSEEILAHNDLDTALAHTCSMLEVAEVMEGLIDDLLDHARIEAGRFQLEEQPLDLHALLRVTEANARTLAQEGVELHLDPLDTVPRWVHGDPLRLRQVLANLLSNALKATSQGHVRLGVEVLEATAGPVHLRFLVEDTGLGIPLDQQKTLFDPFIRVTHDGSLLPGTGLGTTIARELVELMGSTIHLRSVPGQGSSFWFDLRLDRTSQADSLSSASVAPMHWGPVPEVVSQAATILVADDNLSNREVARIHLEGVGHRVVLAENGLQALEACRRQRFDLALLDVQMPVLDGPAVAHAIREEGLSQGPLLALTASTDPRTRERCLKSGITSVLTKPIRRRTLIAAVHQMLSGEEPEPQVSEPARTDGAPLDMDQAVAEFAGDRELVLRILGQFIELAHTQIEQLQAGLQAGDAAMIRRECHRMRGGAANLTAAPLAQAAMLMGRAAKRGDLKGAAVHLDQLKDRLRALEAFLPTQGD